VAILVFAYEQGGATAAGLVSLALLTPTALCAPPAGPAIDRRGASAVLLAGYAAQSLAMAAASLLADAARVASYGLAA
jgi:hypothetical protein